MKYLKTFEKKFQKKLKYNVNDYILIDIDEILRKNKEESIAGSPPDNLAKIEKILNDTPGKDREGDWFPYDIIFFNNQNITIRPEEIIRKLTDDEILEYESKKQGTKYNL